MSDMKVDLDRIIYNTTPTPSPKSLTRSTVSTANDSSAPLFLFPSLPEDSSASDSKKFNLESLTEKAHVPSESIELLHKPKPFQKIPVLNASKDSFYIPLQSENLRSFCHQNSRTQQIWNWIKQYICCIKK